MPDEKQERNLASRDAKKKAPGIGDRKKPTRASGGRDGQAKVFAPRGAGLLKKP
jgi:hypothetical protein